ncbi:MAG: hypothetical protein M5U17_04595 [Ignavibacterium sp.]|nr:hypothetical protein [Ignavibacterium sp.]
MLKLLFITVVIWSTNIYSQIDPNNDPNWNWLLEPAYTLYHTDFPVGQYISPTSPFLQPGMGAGVYDNRQEDGWLLLMRDFGTPTRQTSLPFFILYNKYQGILRIFVYTRMPATFEVGSLKVETDQSFDPTVVGTFFDNIAWGINDIDKVKNRNMASTVPITSGSWLFSDIPIAYDENITQKANSRLNFRPWGITNYDLELTGLGTINQVLGENQPGNIGNPGLFQAGGDFEAVTKSAAGTQETWLKW